MLVVSQRVFDIKQFLLCHIHSPYLSYFRNIRSISRRAFNIRFIFDAVIFFETYLPKLRYCLASPRGEAVTEWLMRCRIVKPLRSIIVTGKNLPPHPAAVAATFPSRGRLTAFSEQIFALPVRGRRKFMESKNMGNRTFLLSSINLKNLLVASVIRFKNMQTVINAFTLFCHRCQFGNGNSFSCCRSA